MIDGEPIWIEPLHSLLKRTAYEHVFSAIQSKGGDRVAAARELQISLATLYRMVKGTRRPQPKQHFNRPPKPPKPAPGKRGRPPKPRPPYAPPKRNTALVKYVYRQRKRPKDNANYLLAFFLGRKVKVQRVSFWYENRYELESIYRDAHHSYLRT